jgi:alpha-ketoglutarate-dependent taurine dioxygenase
VKAASDSTPSTRTGPAGARGRRTVTVPTTELVSARPWDSPSGQPLVVTPSVRGVDLAAWVVDNRGWFDEQLHRHAGIVFEGFGASVDDFERFMLAVSGELLPDPGRPHLAGPRDQVYRSTDYPPEHEIFMHNETWWQYKWAMKIFFNCQVRPGSGGATTMADCRRVLAGLDQAIVESFADGLLHVRNFGPRIGLRPWQEAFGTKERAPVEQFLTDHEIQWEWRTGDCLHTWYVRPVIATHPVTGERVWFNHAAHGHMTTNTTPDMAAAVAAMSRYDVPFNTYHADGSPIEPSIMDAIREAYRREIVAFPWEPGNVMVLDNMLAAHGREPFTGSRRVLVGLTEPTEWSRL